MKFLRDITDRQMTRSEFLKAICMIAIALFGLSNFINAVSRQNHGDTHNAISQRKGHGFGSSKFGV